VVWGLRLGALNPARAQGSQGSDPRAQGLGSIVYGFRVEGLGFRVQGEVFKVQGSGFRVQGSGFRK